MRSPLSLPSLRVEKVAHRLHIRSKSESTSHSALTDRKHRRIEESYLYLVRTTAIVTSGHRREVSRRLLLPAQVDLT